MRCGTRRSSLRAVPDRVYPLTPLYADAFDSELGTIVFRRDGDRVVSSSAWCRTESGTCGFARARPAGEAKRVLAFGDSNTWGWIPVERGYPTTRYRQGQRWPGVAQAELGSGYEIVEEALNGRTIDLADPAVPELPGAGFDGSAYLPAAVASHLPLDLVVIMLGTNDLKTSIRSHTRRAFLRRASKSSSNSSSAQDGAAWTEYRAPKVLVVAPPPMSETERFPAQVLAAGVEKSRQLAARYETAALPPVSSSRCGPHHAGGRRGRASPECGCPSTARTCDRRQSPRDPQVAPRGRKLISYAWASPNSLIGLVIGGVMSCSARGRGVIAGVLEVGGGLVGTLLGREADRVALARDDARPRDPRDRRVALNQSRAHEHVHVRQYEQWGPFFLPAYAASSLWQLACGRRCYRDNWFERQAYEQS